ncbi:uncharacterized protein LOC130641572 isoform X2 [Hydractinia symbiolongicarpus]|uniref:uncharacterized protein LOC130641572 isoform X2 n=1 Tax=Hydractinia symbiolongicarpus TaxID=13093 RepID=UPI00254CFD4F|nr:uncharacterized protein LOC130641572 isoform X2 [Hydractinia symbiolongicarpus]
MLASEREKSTHLWVQRHSMFRMSQSEPGAVKPRRTLRFDDNIPSMGRRVDVSHLTEEECGKVLDVISKDILIRKSEKERVGYITKKFEELRRAVILSNSNRKKLLPFDDYCLICGKHLFTFCCFFQRGGECVSCENSCCSSCRKAFAVENEERELYLCNLCINKRRVKGEIGEWYYEVTDKRFKRFGSAKALRAIYKQRASIEPRVITLLALCRELQPTRKISLAIIKNRYSRQILNDEDKATYCSSFSDLDAKEDLFRPHLRKRIHSESDLPVIAHEMEETVYFEKDLNSSVSAKKAVHRSRSDEFLKVNHSKKNSDIELKQTVSKHTIVEQEGKIEELEKELNTTLTKVKTETKITSSDV